MKYVMFKGDLFIIIPDLITHSGVKELGTPISAGFCSINQDKYGKYVIHCWGESNSLKLKSGENDGAIMSAGLNL